jgi:DmsE family decaheme c-type cytochrome
LLRATAQWLLVLTVLWLAAAWLGATGYAGQSTSNNTADVALPWAGESPYWAPGQEFAAVVGAPFIGSAECLKCHEDLGAGFLKSAHSRSLNDPKMPLDYQGCEGCHGAGGAHSVLESRGAIFAFDWRDSERHNRICLRCHEWQATDVEWERLSHARAGLRCTDCHDVHAPADHPQRFLLREKQDMLCVNCHQDVDNDFFRVRRHPVVLNVENSPTATEMHCTDCHDVHAGEGPYMLTEATATETCLTCHIGKGGPFRYPHMAVQDLLGGGCLDCHLPHGSDNPWLLVVDGRALCLQCHGDQADHQPALTCWAAGCHIQVHGSNDHALLFR